jgi:hypothetical protein
VHEDVLEIMCYPDVFGSSDVSFCFCDPPTLRRVHSGQMLIGITGQSIAKYRSKQSLSHVVAIKSGSIARSVEAMSTADSKFHALS